MRSSKVFAWGTGVVASCILIISISADSRPAPSLGTFLFWTVLLIIAGLLPVTVGWGVEVTMTFPIYLALILIFSEQSWVPMVIAALGSVNLHELRGETAPHKAVFNRAQWIIAIFLASLLANAVSPNQPYVSPLAVGGSAATALSVNLGLVALGVSLDSQTSFTGTISKLVPKPIAGFLLIYSLVAVIGAAAATVYERFANGAWLVTAVLIPLFFARLSIMGARRGQELAESLREQQQRQLEVTERAFSEREVERRRIAAEIHDTSLQMLAAATFGAENALSFLDQGQLDLSRRAMVATQSSVKHAIADLRSSVTELRESLLEHEHLEDSLKAVIEQLAVFWGVEVALECTISKEPSVPIAMAAKQIVNEAVTNALKHSESEDIRVKVTDADGTLTILVEDGGPGFDEERAASASGHMGLQLMKERATAVGGRLRIESSRSGTRLEALFPGVRSA